MTRSDWTEKSYAPITGVQNMMVAVLVLLEPFGCDAFIRDLGGHLLFDLALLLNAVADAINAGKHGKLE